MVCPPGLEPGPGASEALMVSNSTTGTFCIFMLYFQKFSKIYTENKIEFQKILLWLFFAVGYHFISQSVKRV